MGRPTKKNAKSHRESQADYVKRQKKEEGEGTYNAGEAARMRESRKRVRATMDEEELERRRALQRARAERYRQKQKNATATSPAETAPAPEETAPAPTTSTPVSSTGDREGSPSVSEITGVSESSRESRSRSKRGLLKVIHHLLGLYIRSQIY